MEFSAQHAERLWQTDVKVVERSIVARIPAADDTPLAEVVRRLVAAYQPERI